jgi:hypothetical protein
MRFRKWRFITLDYVTVGCVSGRMQEEQTLMRDLLSNAERVNPLWVCRRTCYCIGGR